MIAFICFVQLEIQMPKFCIVITGTFKLPKREFG